MIVVVILIVVKPLVKAVQWKCLFGSVQFLKNQLVLLLKWCKFVIEKKYR